ncbi:hypothetical protein ACHAP7_007285 [Fusarium lateritium]
MASEITSSGLASEFSTISSTIVSEVTTGVDTSTADTTTVPASIIEATTTVLSASIEVTSTETGITDTTTALTSLESTTTIEATTTTTAEQPIITDFRLKGSRGSVEGAFIYSNRVAGSSLIFSGSNPAYSPATFSIEAQTGRLMIDNSLYVCAFFKPNQQDIASLGICNNPPENSEVDVACTPPTKDGDTLSCSVPALLCYRSVCGATEQMLTGTSTDFNYNINENVAVIGQITNGVGFMVHAL